MNKLIELRSGEIGADAYDGQGDPSFYGSSCITYSYEGLTRDEALTLAHAQHPDVTSIQAVNDWPSGQPIIQVLDF